MERYRGDKNVNVLYCQHGVSPSLQSQASSYATVTLRQNSSCFKDLTVREAGQPWLEDGVNRWIVLCCNPNDELNQMKDKLGIISKICKKKYNTIRMFYTILLVMIALTNFFTFFQSSGTKLFLLSDPVGKFSLLHLQLSFVIYMFLPNGKHCNSLCICGSDRPCNSLRNNILEKEIVQGIPGVLTNPTTACWPGDS